MLRGELPAPLVGSEAAGRGRATGPLVPANLEVLRSLIGTPWLPDLAGTIVALEEIGERPYRIDRALTQLQTSGALAGVRGFAVGQLCACEEPASWASGWPRPGCRWCSACPSDMTRSATRRCRAGRGSSSTPTGRR
jgi:muramoyltetrapeptide carboxypeptidase